MGELNTPEEFPPPSPEELEQIPPPLGEGRVGVFQGGGSPIVGVFPDHELGRRRRLFDALEQAFDVCFEGRREGEWQGLAGAVCFGDSPSVADTRCPTLHFSLPRNNYLPPVGGGPGLGPTHPGLVTLSDDELMDARLRGRSFSDAMAGGLHELPVEDGDRALARCGRAALWIRRRGADGIARYVAAAAPDELNPNEPLRNRLTQSRFIALLPLIHFLREVRAERPWMEPSPRACFIIDDPNLRAPAYGHVNYRDLAEHAARAGYHVAIASIPLDFRSIHPRVREVFERNRQAISVTVHGNNHERHELLTVRDGANALRVAAQSLRRTIKFERRSGLSVSRVMCAPHEECNPAMAEALFQLGFDALALEPRRQVSAEGHTPNDVLAGWEPARFVDGLPILPRFRLDISDEDLVFNSYLNLPQVIYCHNRDLKAGLHVLDDAARRVNRTGQYRWVTPAEIAATNYVSWRRDTDLIVRLYSRRVRLTVPAGLERVRVAVPRFPGVKMIPSTLVGEGQGGESLEISLVPEAALSPAAVPAPVWRPWPRLRRLMTESRDRATPLMRRLRVS